MQKYNLPQVKWNFIFGAIALFVVAVDQLSKWWIQSNLYPGQSVPENGFFRLIYAQNTGAAFSIFYGNNGILAIIATLGAILILVFVLIYQRRFSFLDTRINKIALGFILGGTLGNLIDRYSLHYVRDFIGVGPWPIFNAADSSTVCGVIIFAISLLFLSRGSIPK
jgi:signal peptidase II